MEAIVLGGIIGFLASLVAQVMIWRIFHVQRELLVLALLFLIFPAAIYLAAYLIVPTSGLTWPMIALLHLVLSSAYVQTYPALREDIPSVAILFIIRDNPGLGSDEIIAKMASRDCLFARKIDDLCRDGLATKHDAGLTLTRSGMMLAMVFHIYRKILGVQRDQG